MAPNNTIQIKVTIECHVYHCLILYNSYEEKPFVNMTQYKLNKYFEISLNASIKNQSEVQFVVISMIYNSCVKVKIIKIYSFYCT